MATDGYASWINGPEFGGLDLRRADSVLQMPGPISAPFSVRAGRRVNGSGLAVSVGGSPEAWTVSPGPATVADPAYATQGAWRISIPNAVSANLPARPGAGQSRIDVIIARIYDPVAIGSGLAEVKIERLNGSAATTPSAPTPPVGAITFELGRLLVPASGPIVVTQSTRRTVAAGGVLPLATSAERAALVAEGVAYPGLTVFDQQAGILDTYTGSGWTSEADTAWAVPTMGSGWASNTGNGYRRKSGHVTLNLNVGKATYATNELVCTLPAGFRPDRTFYEVGQVTGQPRYWFINDAGEVRTTGAATIGILGAVTYPV